jgi:hypothetical protein
MPSLEDLTHSMKQLKDSGEADVKLSKETRDKYVALIKNFRTALKAERDNLNGLEALGNAGTFASATQTKSNLQSNVVDTGGIQKTLDKYLDYLDEFEATVKKSCDRIIESG